MIIHEVRCGRFHLLFDRISSHLRCLIFKSVNSGVCFLGSETTMDHGQFKSQHSSSQPQHSNAFPVLTTFKTARRVVWICTPQKTLKLETQTTRNFSMLAMIWLLSSVSGAGVPASTSIANFLSKLFGRPHEAKLDATS